MQNSVKLRRQELARVIAALPQRLHLVGRHAEQEHILVAHALTNLDVCAVERAERDRAIDHQLHVAGTGGLLTRNGDLLGQVGSRDDDLGQRDFIVFNEDHLELVLHLRVRVYKIGNGDDERNDLLGQIIACGCLGREDECLRIDRLFRVILDIVVKRQDMQDIQQLPLVFMQALDLHVEDRIRVDVDTVVLRDISGKAYLVLALDGLQIFQNIRIVTVLEQRFERVRVVQEAVADERLQIAGQGRVRLAQPAAVRNAVCDVQEAAVIEIIIIPEDGFFKNIRVQLRNAVDLVAAGQAQVRHANLAVRDSGHILPLAGIVRIDAVQLFHEAAVDLLTDGVNARQLLPEQIDRPTLKCLGHDGMVGVGKRRAGDLPRAFPAIVVLVDQQAHQLWHAERRMRIVDVHGNLVSQVIKRMVIFQMLVQDRLQ